MLKGCWSVAPQRHGKIAERNTRPEDKSVVFPIEQDGATQPSLRALTMRSGV